MARKRMIDPGFWTDEKLGMLPRDARLLFMGLISNADDEGRLSGHPVLIRSTIFPYDDIPVEDVEKWLQFLHDAELITRYESNDQRYIHVTNFNKHQTINRPQESKLPPPPERGDTTNTQLERYSVNEHGTITEHSLNDHGTLTPNRREMNRREGEDEEVITEPPSPTTSTPESDESPINYWQRKMARLPNSLQRDQLTAYEDDGFPSEVIKAAMDRAMLAGADLRYAFGVLDSWREKGIYTLGAVERETSDYRGRVAPAQSQRKSRYDPIAFQKMVEEAGIDATRSG